MNLPNAVAPQLRGRNNGAAVNPSGQVGRRGLANPPATAQATDPANAADPANNGADQANTTDGAAPNPPADLSDPANIAAAAGNQVPTDAMGGNPMFQSWLNAGYSSQIQLATLAKDKAQSPLVRDFAAQSLQSGTRFSQMLQQMSAGTGSDGGSIDANGNGLRAGSAAAESNRGNRILNDNTQRAIASGTAARDRNAQQRGPSSPGTNATEPKPGALPNAATDSSATTTDTATTSTATTGTADAGTADVAATADGSRADDVMSGMDLVNDLQNLGSNFDQVYLNVQVASLVNRLNSLAAMSQNVPENMQDLIAQDFAATRQQILRARNILSQLDSGGAGASDSSTSQTPRLRSRTPNAK